MASTKIQYMTRTSESGVLKIISLRRRTQELCLRVGIFSEVSGLAFSGMLIFTMKPTDRFHKSAVDPRYFEKYCLGIFNFTLENDHY